MGAIDVGIIGGTPVEANSGINRTWICKDNPANDDGIINKVTAKTAAGITNLIIGIFYNTGGTNFSTRSYKSVGSINGTVTFDVNLDIKAGDYIGFSNEDGSLGIALTGYSGTWRDTSGTLYIPCTDHTFVSNSSSYGIYLYGTGKTLSVGSPVPRLIAAGIL